MTIDPETQEALVGFLFMLYPIAFMKLYRYLHRPDPEADRMREIGMEIDRDCDIVDPDLVTR